MALISRFSRLALLLILTLVGSAAACRQGGSSDEAQNLEDTGRGSAEICSEGPIFADRAVATGLDFVHWNGMTGDHYLPEITGSGVGLVDYDGDGDLDVYLVQMNLLDPRAQVADALVPPPGDVPLTDRLFRNELVETGQLRFTDVTREAGLQEATGYGMGVAAADYDNDGDVDLYITNLGRNQLWGNQGDGTFVDVTEVAGADDRRWSVPAVFFDYDQDGLLDLYVGNYLAFNLGTHHQCETATGFPDWCGPLSYRPETDRLLHNEGEGRFRDASRETGVGEQAGNALGAIVADLDGDGLLDLYVANDQMENFLWRNLGDGSFEEHALLGGSAVSGEGRAQASMGVDAGDIDADGDLDLFITHLTDEPNTLYVNDGAGLFSDLSTPSGLGMASWPMTGFGVGFLDYDNDGLLDVLAVNGAVRAIPSLRSPEEPLPLRQAGQLFHNLGAGRFEDVTAIAGEALSAPAVSRGAAFGDVNNDGATDVVVNSVNGPARMLLNLCGSRQSWIGIEVLERNGRYAIGAQVTVHSSDGERQLRRVHSDGSYASANDPRVVVGLGDRERIEALEVRWADGVRERFGALPVRGYHVLRQGTGTTVVGRP